MAGIEEGEVVVRLGPFGIVLGKAREDGDGLGHLVLLGEDQPFEKARLRILGLAGEKGVDLLQRLGVLPLLAAKVIASSRGENIGSARAAVFGHKFGPEIARTAHLRQQRHV